LNTFTDSAPAFPYQCSEATHQLGIPDSPAIHLAISNLAESLLASSPDCADSLDDIRRLALRTASYGVLMSQSLELTVVRFRASCGLSFDHDVASQPTDWLAHAVARLEAEGFRNSEGALRQRSRYGWIHERPIA
jgi:hypothetical protein